MSDVPDRSISDARRNLAAVVDEARASHEPVFPSRRGRRVAVLVPADDFELLRVLAEDMADILDAIAARQEMREAAAEPVAWRQVTADLGLA
jgi:prevent-host-death family protein